MKLLQKVRHHFFRNMMYIVYLLADENECIGDSFVMVLSQKIFLKNNLETVYIPVECVKLITYCNLQKGAEI